MLKNGTSFGGRMTLTHLDRVTFHVFRQLSVCSKKLNEKILRVKKKKKKISRRQKNISQKEVAPSLHQPSSLPMFLSNSSKGIPTSLYLLRIITSSKLFHTLLHLILTIILQK